MIMRQYISNTHIFFKGLLDEIRTLSVEIIELIFPKHPLLKKLERISLEKILEICPACKNLNEGDSCSIWAIFEYRNELVEKIIFDIKNNKNSIIRAKVGHILASEILKLFPEILNNEKIYIVPVPTTDRRIRERGFSQTNLLTKDIVNFNPSRFVSGIDKIKYVKKHKPQTSVGNREARMKNVSGSMLCADLNFFYKKHTMIVDDVYTTGASMKETVRALKKAEPKSIRMISVAH